MTRIALILVLTVAGACATFFSLESSVDKDTRKTREACEAAAKAGQDTSAVCRAHLKVPK